jgi:hypothetical protein
MRSVNLLCLLGFLTNSFLICAAVGLTLGRKYEEITVRPCLIFKPIHSFSSEYDDRKALYPGIPKT